MSSRRIRPQTTEHDRNVATLSSSAAHRQQLRGTLKPPRCHPVVSCTQHVMFGLCSWEKRRMSIQCISQYASWKWSKITQQLHQVMSLHIEDTSRHPRVRRLRPPPQFDHRGKYPQCTTWCFCIELASLWLWRFDPLLQRGAGDFGILLAGRPTLKG